MYMIKLIVLTLLLLQVTKACDFDELFERLFNKDRSEEDDNDNEEPYARPTSKAGSTTTPVPPTTTQPAEQNQTSPTTPIKKAEEQNPVKARYDVPNEEQRSFNWDLDDYTDDLLKTEPLVKESFGNIYNSHPASRKAVDFEKRHIRHHGYPKPFKHLNDGQTKRNGIRDIFRYYKLREYFERKSSHGAKKAYPQKYNYERCQNCRQFPSLNHFSPYFNGEPLGMTFNTPSIHVNHYYDKVINGHAVVDSGTEMESTEPEKIFIINFPKQKGYRLTDNNANNKFIIKYQDEKSSVPSQPVSTLTTDPERFLQLQTDTTQNKNHLTTKKELDTHKLEMPIIIKNILTNFNKEAEKEKYSSSGTNSAVIKNPPTEEKLHNVVTMQLEGPLSVVIKKETDESEIKDKKTDQEVPPKKDSIDNKVTTIKPIEKEYAEYSVKPEYDQTQYTTDEEVHLNQEPEYEHEYQGHRHHHHHHHRHHYEDHGKPDHKPHKHHDKASEHKEYDGNTQFEEVFAKPSAPFKEHASSEERPATIGKIPAMVIPHKFGVTFDTFKKPILLFETSNRFGDVGNEETSASTLDTSTEGNKNTTVA